MAVTAMNTPDFRSISDFRKRYLLAMADLFVQVLRLCRAACLVQLSHVAIDGTKLKANASRHKAMSYVRMKQAEEKLQTQIADWLRRTDEDDSATSPKPHGDGLRSSLSSWQWRRSSNAAGLEIGTGCGNRLLNRSFDIKGLQGFSTVFPSWLQQVRPE
jgi:hypothetical protein